MKSLHKTSTSGQAVLQQYIALAREAGPPILPDTDARRMVRQAMLAGEGRRQSRARSWQFSVAAAAACAVAAGIWVMRDIESHRYQPATLTAPDGKPLRMRLPSNDVLVATAGARFELKSAEPEKRLVELSGGAMLFEVTPLADGQRFEVRTPHARVSVRGTIFTVQVTRSHSRVRVYQGRVRVRTASASRVLFPGESYASDDAAPGPAAETPLHGEALAAVRRRQAEILEPAPNRETEPIPSEVQAPSPDAGDISFKCPRPTLQQARSWLRQGHARSALLAAREALQTTHEQRGAWTMLEADALRALGNFREAAGAYEAASRLSPPGARAQAGYLSALVHFKRLDQPQKALYMLNIAAVDSQTSPLRERGLLLRARVLQRLGRSPKKTACRYLADFPDSVGAEQMRDLCAGQAVAK
jgi:ferric-dicitrate binding protein FerR (iron transport regulator)